MNEHPHTCLSTPQRLGDLAIGPPRPEPQQQCSTMSIRKLGQKIEHLHRTLGNGVIRCLPTRCGESLLFPCRRTMPGPARIHHRHPQVPAGIACIVEALDRADQRILGELFADVDPASQRRRPRNRPGPVLGRERIDASSTRVTAHVRLPHIHPKMTPLPRSCVTAALEVSTTGTPCPRSELSDRKGT